MIFKKTATQKIADYCSQSKTEYVKVDHYKPNRTLEQNALFHKWCEIIADGTGFTPSEVKYYLKLKFLGLVDLEVFGNFHKMVKPTSGLNVDGFKRLLNEIQHWSLHELNIQLPNRETLLYG